MATTSAAASRSLDWRMWVPCLGMALCSWLSFVDRQVLTILSPDHHSRHRPDRAELHGRGVVLLPRLHARQPRLGIGARPRRPARRHAARGRHLDRRERVARLHGQLPRLRDGPRRPRPRRGRDVPGRAAHGRRVAARPPARARDRAVVLRRHDRRRDDAAAPRAARDSVRLARGVHVDGRPRRGVAGPLGDHRPSTVPAGNTADDRQSGVAELPRSAACGR